MTDAGRMLFNLLVQIDVAKRLIGIENWQADVPGSTLETLLHLIGKHQDSLSEGDLAVLNAVGGLLIAYIDQRHVATREAEGLFERLTQGGQHNG